MTDEADMTPFEILSPGHPRWGEFVVKLSRSLIVTDTKWRCDGDRHYRYTKQVMGEMGYGEIDIAETLQFFQAHGGFCDCEVMFNVACPAMEADDD